MTYQIIAMSFVVIGPLALMAYASWVDKKNKTR
jgi:hypothetical protein